MRRIIKLLIMLIAVTVPVTAPYDRNRELLRHLHSYVADQVPTLFRQVPTLSTVNYIHGRKAMRVGLRALYIGVALYKRSILILRSTHHAMREERYSQFMEPCNQSALKVEDARMRTLSIRPPVLLLMLHARSKFRVHHVTNRRRIVLNSGHFRPHWLAHRFRWKRADRLFRQQLVQPVERVELVHHSVAVQVYLLPQQHFAQLQFLHPFWPASH